MSNTTNLGMTPKKNKLDDQLRLINSPAQKSQDLYERLIRASPQKKLFHEEQYSCSEIQQEQLYSSQMVPEEEQSEIESSKKQVQKQEKIFNQTDSACKRITTPIKTSKGCNCEKSHCLKKYCDCFKVGQVCSQSCSCIGCENSQITQQHQKQIRIVQLTRSGKGGRQPKCNCQKSHCLKNYCECHSAGRSCSSSCNCVQCQNKTNQTIKTKKKRQLMQISQWSQKKPNKQNVLFN